MDKGKGMGAPQPRAPRTGFLSKDSDSDLDSDSEPETGYTSPAAPRGAPEWSEEDVDELLADMAESSAEQHSVNTGEPVDDEMEMTDVPPLIVHSEDDSPLSKSRKARERRRKAEGMKASRYATPGASGVHPDRINLIGRLATPPAPLLLNRDGSTTKINPLTLTPASFGASKQTKTATALH